MCTIMYLAKSKKKKRKKVNKSVVNIISDEGWADVGESYMLSGGAGYYDLKTSDSEEFTTTLNIASLNLTASGW